MAEVLKEMPVDMHGMIMKELNFDKDKYIVTYASSKIDGETVSTWRVLSTYATDAFELLRMVEQISAPENVGQKANARTVRMFVMGELVCANTDYVTGPSRLPVNMHDIERKVRVMAARQGRTSGYALAMAQLRARGLGK